MKKMIALIIVCLVFPCVASAEIIKYHYTGTSPIWSDGTWLGTVSGTIGYDPSTEPYEESEIRSPDGTVIGHHALYQTGFITGTVMGGDYFDGYSWSFDQSDDIHIGIDEQNSYYAMTFGMGDGGISGSGGSYFNLSDYEEPVLRTLPYLPSTLDLDDFSGGNEVWVWTRDGRYWSGVNWNITSLNPIPEPATMLLLGTGLFGLAVIGRKRFKK